MAIIILLKNIHIVHTQMWEFFDTSQVGNLSYTKVEILIFTPDAV